MVFAKTSWADALSELYDASIAPHICCMMYLCLFLPEGLVQSITAICPFLSLSLHQPAHCLIYIWSLNYPALQVLNQYHHSNYLASQQFRVHSHSFPLLALLFDTLPGLSSIAVWALWGRWQHHLFLMTFISLGYSSSSSNLDYGEVLHVSARVFNSSWFPLVTSEWIPVPPFTSIIDSVPEAGFWEEHHQL